LKEKIIKRDSLFLNILIVQYHSIQFTNLQSVFAAWGELLNEHSNATINKCAGTAQLFHKGSKSRKNVENIIKLITNILHKLKPQFNETRVTDLQRITCQRLLTYFVRIKIFTVNQLFNETICQMYKFLLRICKIINNNNNDNNNNNNNNKCSA